MDPSDMMREELIEEVEQLRMKLANERETNAALCDRSRGFQKRVQELEQIRADNSKQIQQMRERISELETPRRAEQMFNVQCPNCQANRQYPKNILDTQETIVCLTCGGTIECAV